MPPRRLRLGSYHRLCSRGDWFNWRAAVAAGLGRRGRRVVTGDDVLGHIGAGGLLRSTLARLLGRSFLCNVVLAGCYIRDVVVCLGLLGGALARLARRLVVSLRCDGFFGDAVTSIVSAGSDGTCFAVITVIKETKDAYRSVEWKVVFMIFGMLGLGLGLQETQVVSLLAKTMVEHLESLGPHAVLAIVYLTAAVLTEIISNNAVAALLTPVAIGIAQALGLDPRAFVIAVMFGSSASFVTPIGYQTNTYVYGAGGYRFSDFSRIGFPLAVLLWIVAIILIPLYWPFVVMET